MKRIAGLGLLAFCLLSAQASAQDTEAKKVTLKWKWKQGQVLRYRMSMTQNQTMTGSQNRTLKNETIYYWLQKVETVDAQGHAVLSVTYQRAILNTKGVTGTMKFDSDDKTVNRRDPQTKVFTALIGRPFKMVVSSRGNVMKVVGINKIAESVIKDLGGPRLNAETAAVIRLQLSNKNMRQQMDDLLSVLPEKNIAVGHKWSRGPVKTDHPLGFVVKNDKITLKSIENKKGREYGVIETKQDTKITLTHKENPTLQAYDIDTKFKDSQGVIQFDIAGGFLKKLVHNLTTDMKFTGKQQKGIDIHSVVKQNTTILLMPIEEPENKEKTKAKSKQ